jgi:hypothetical protein
LKLGARSTGSIPTGISAFTERVKTGTGYKNLSESII